MSFNLINAPNSLQNIPHEKVNELDVRPILRAGGEPFKEIMAAVKNTSAGGALRLRATFEPMPLFRVLGAQGWNHWVEYGKDDDWIVWFYQSGDQESEPATSTPTIELRDLLHKMPELVQRLKTTSKNWVLDVRCLAPPEPLELTLAVAEKLPPGTVLTQVNQRVPQFLFPLLDERNLEYQVIKDEGDEIHVEIRRRSP